MKNIKTRHIASIIIGLFIAILIIFLFQYKQEMLDNEKLFEAFNKNGLNFKYRVPSLFYVYLDLIRQKGLAIMMFIPPFLVLITALHSIHKKMKTGFYKNIVNTRMPYKKFIKKEIFNSYKYAFIVPVMFLIMLIGCGILTGFNIQLSLEGLDQSIFTIAFNNPIILVIFTFINLLLADILYINIGLMGMIKSKNMFINIVFSYLVITMIGIVFEIFIGYGLALLTKMSVFANIFNFYNIWLFNLDVVNILYVTGYLIFMALVSSLIVFKYYLKEEKVFQNV